MPTIGERFNNLFRRVQVSADQIVGRIPFVHIVGHEKTYGEPQPKEYARFVESYKSWVFACVWKNATSLAKNQIKLCKRTVVNGEEQLDPIMEHPFIDVINNVNPFSNRFELMTITQINLELTGNAYWWIPKNRLGVPYMIWNIPSHWVTIVPSPEEFISGYVVHVPKRGEKIPFPEDEIIHFKFPTPFDIFYGSSPTLAGAHAIDLNLEIKKWGINYFLNNAQPSGVLTTKDSLSPEGYKRLRREWNRKYQGSGNAGKMAILEDGLTFQQIGSSIKDARFDVVNKDIRNEILAMYGVPASKLGLVEDVNRANADANDYTYQKDTIQPRLTLIEEKLNEKFIPIYDKNLVCKFENPVPEDKEFMLLEREKNITTGFSSIDDERKKAGLEPYNLPETSVPLITFSLTPAGQPKPDIDPFTGLPTGGGDEEEESDDDKKKPKDEKKAYAFKNEDQRRRKWETFAIVTEAIERTMTARMKNYFDNQKSIVKQNLSKYNSLPKAHTKDLFTNILFSLNEANADLKARTQSQVRQSFEAGLRLGGADVGNIIDLDLFEPNIIRAVEERMGFFVEKVNLGTVKLLEEAVREGIEEGESIADISARIDKIYGYSRDFRSKRIAQTEVIGGTNAGQLRAYTESGVKRKEWLTARDGKVRDSHRIEGTEEGIKDINDTFHLIDPATGRSAELLYAGDRSTGASPEFVINCRCTVVPVI